MAKPEVKATARRLRMEERLSVKEIATRLKVSQSSVSYWTRDIPLSHEERYEKMSLNGSKSWDSRPRKQLPQPSTPFRHLVNLELLTNAQKAKASEAACTLRLNLLGATIYTSPFDGDKVDALIDVQGRLLRVQVKTVRYPPHNMNPFVPFVCSSGRNKLRRYEKGEMDVLVAYDLQHDTCYVWLAEELTALKGQVALSEASKEGWHKIFGSKAEESRHSTVAGNEAGSSPVGAASLGQ